MWDSENACWTNTESDYSKPVDPNLTSADFAGKTAAQAIALHNGAAGGTGFDLAESGYSIQYIKVEGVTGYAGGEIDGFADVAAVPELATIALLAMEILGFVGKRRKN